MVCGVLGPVDVVAEVDSTNQVLLDRARAGAVEGLVLVADHQTAGRGRSGRSWEAAPGAALLVSVLLRPSLAPAEAHLVTTVAGLAAVDVCAELGADVALKWPNDVVADDRKLAGLLSESVVVGDTVQAVVVGMGMNLRDGALPDGAVALDALAGARVARDDVLSAWLVHLDQRYADLQAPGGVASTLTGWRAACVTLGRRVRVELPTESFVGEAVDLDDSGRLVVATVDGTRALAAADVVHVRPGPG
jgi:BirA family biotin operon repressor/biotin-[acetyl-CoA-carboxylase] ligase